MSIYTLPEFKISLSKKNRAKTWLLLVVLVSVFFGGVAGFLAGYFSQQNLDLPVLEKETVVEKEYIPQTGWEEKIIQAVSKASPSVVSIIVTKDLPVIEEYYENPFKEFEDFFGEEFFDFQVPRYRQKGTEKREVGGGTGFIISRDGLVLTNKHVVSDQEAEYTVLTNEGEKLQARVLGRDPFKDLAVLKIEAESSFEPLELGDSDTIKPGQTVIAIGNALGEFQNTVSVGVVSGLRRQVVASGGGESEVLKNLIQTDAAINRGNSGGPLLNLKGRVIGINVAMSEVAENIGFAISINEAKRDIEQAKKMGKIVYPFLGIYYTPVTEEIQEAQELPVSYGAWVGMDREGRETEVAVVQGSAAQKAGIKKGDIILKFDGQKITEENPLAEIILGYSPGELVVLRILRKGYETSLPVTLEGKSG